MGRIYTRVHRLLRLVIAIQGKRGLKVPDLAQLLEIHERTVFDDLSTLNASGVPCVFDAETDGYCIRPGFFMPAVELTFDEAMAILALLEEVAGKEQIPFLGIAARAGEKIRSQLPAEVLQAIEPLDDRVQIDLSPTMADESCRDVYDNVRDAIASRRMIRCTYEVPGSSHGDDDSPFIFKPYCLFFSQRAWYCVGHHEVRGAIRQLKLNRFTSLHITDRPFGIPDNFDIRKELGLAWRMIRGKDRHQVSIRFAPAFADNASETRWHATQQEQWNDDGSVTLSFTVDGLDEVVWWVMSYGPNAQVLAPPELIARVRELAQATAEQYGQP